MLNIQRMKFKEIPILRLLFQATAILLLTNGHVNAIMQEPAVMREPGMMRGRGISMEPGLQMDIMREAAPLLDLAVAADSLASGLNSRRVVDAINTEVSAVQAKISSQFQIDQQAFSAGIDSAIAPLTDFVGPHLLTQDAAFDIERAGRAFLETASGTAERLNVPTAQAGVQFRKAMIMPPRLPQPLMCPYDRRKWPSCDNSAKYRTYDGSCNNLDNPLWGRAMTPFERFIPPWYDDGISSPRQVSFANGQLPNPRRLSFEFHQPISRHMPDLNHFAMEYGQFLSHDIQFNALSRGYGNTNLDCCRRPGRVNCFPIQIPSDDPFFHNRTCMNFVRALPTPNLDCTLGVREQLNQNTHFHDASMIYGSSKVTADSLRTFSDGMLKMSGDFLPKDTSTGAGCIRTVQARPCFRAGDVRANQQPGLVSFHTIWVREHNQLVQKLAQVNPAWRGDDETLYQEARRIVIAMLQHVTYSEYLSVIMGPAQMNRYGLKPRSSGYFTGYDRSEKPMIRNGFSTAAFRFGHSMIRDTMPTHNGATQTSNAYLKDLFLKPDLVYTRGIDEIARGLTRSKSEKVDKYISAQVTRHLFERQPGFGGDLAAININRGRDHGLPHYKLWRRHCGLAGDYSHTPAVRAALQAVYRDPEDMDLFTAGVSEKAVPGGKVGPTFACLLGEQFRSMKKGDRFYYENDGANSFTPDQLRAIRKMTMSKIICRNTGIQQIQRNAFKDVIPGNPLVNCRYIGDLDLNPWKPGNGGCVPVHGKWSSWSRTPCFGNFRIRYRMCNNPSPNECGRPCKSSGQPFEIQMEFCGIWNPPRWDRFRPNRRMGIEDPFRMARLDGAARRTSAAAAPDAELTSDMTSQVESAISKMLTPGQKSIDASVFEKAISSVSSSKAASAVVGPNVGPVRPLEIRHSRDDLLRSPLSRA